MAVIDFWAQFCGPCRRIAPDYEALSNKYKEVQFFKCNTREDGPDLVSDMHGVRALPTFVFYKNKSELRQLRFEGANMAQLEKIVQKYGRRETFTGTGQSLGQGGSSSDIRFQAPLIEDPQLDTYVIKSLCSIFCTQ